MKNWIDVARFVIRTSGGVLTAFLLAGAVRTWAGLQEEIDEFLKQENSFGKFQEAAPAPKAAEVPAEAEVTVSEPAPAEAAKAPEPAVAQQPAEHPPLKEEASPPTAVPVEPAAETLAPIESAVRQASVAELQKALASRTQELESARRENASLKDVIRRIWDASKQERLNSHYNMGCVYRAYRQYKMAESEFLKALQMEPNDSGVHYNLAILYDDDLKDKAKARKQYERFLELAPDDKDAPRVREWLVTLQ